MPVAHQEANRSSLRPLAGPKRWLFVLLGVGCIALASLGVVLPGLPTTPFLILASYFLVRSSPRLHGWLVRSRTFGPLLRNWQEHRGVTRNSKRVALVAAAVAIALSVVLGGLPWFARVLVAAAGLFGMLFVARLPVVPANGSR